MPSCSRQGEVTLRLPREHGHVAALSAGAGAVLFTRPEELVLVPAGGAQANLGVGTIDTHVYQGTHVDVYVRFDDGRVLRVRHPGFEAMSRFPIGSRAGVSANLAKAFLFPET